MSASECRQRFSRRSDTAFLHIFEPLPDALVHVCLRGNIEQTLKHCCPSSHSQNHRPIFFHTAPFSQNVGRQD